MFRPMAVAFRVGHWHVSSYGCSLSRGPLACFVLCSLSRGPLACFVL